MPRPDNRIARTLPGRDPMYDVSDRRRAVTLDKQNLAEIEKLAHVNRTPDGPGQRRYKTAGDAAEMLAGLNTGRRSVAERMIQSVVDDARDLFGIAKEGLSHGFTQHMVKAMIEAGLQIREDNELSKAGPFIGPRGGKWADAEMTIPWKDSRSTGNAARDRNRTKAKNAQRAKSKSDTKKKGGKKMIPGLPVKAKDRAAKDARKKSGAAPPAKGTRSLKPAPPAKPFQPKPGAKPAKAAKPTPAKSAESKAKAPKGAKGAAPTKGGAAKPPFGKKGPPGKGTQLPGKDKPPAAPLFGSIKAVGKVLPDGRKPYAPGVPVPQADAPERDIDKRMKPGEAHEEISSRFEKIKKLAGEHNVRVTGKVNANHSHAHMDELEKRVGLKVASRFGVQPKDVQHGAHMSPSMPAAHASQLPPHGQAQGAAPGPGSPMGASGQQGGSASSPGGSAQPGGPAVPTESAQQSPGGPPAMQPHPSAMGAGGMAPAGGAPPQQSTPMNAPPVQPPSLGGAPPAGPAVGQPPGHPHPSHIPQPAPPPGAGAAPNGDKGGPPSADQPPSGPPSGGGDQLPPDVNESSPHGQKMIGEAVDTQMDKLTQIKSRVTQPHHKQMLNELKQDAASVKKAPSRSAFQWLSHKIASFVALVGGAAIGGLAGGPAGALTGAMLGKQMVKSERLMIDTKTGRTVLVKGETLEKAVGGWTPIPGGSHGGMRRRRAKGWDYWYPSQEAVQTAKDEHGKKQIDIERFSSMTRSGYPKDPAKKQEWQEHGDIRNHASDYLARRPSNVRVGGNKPPEETMAKNEGDRGGHVIGHTASGHAIYAGTAPPVHNPRPPTRAQLDANSDEPKTAITKLHDAPSGEHTHDEKTEHTPSGQRPVVKLPTYAHERAYEKAHGGMSASWHANTAKWHGKERDKAAAEHAQLQSKGASTPAERDRLHAVASRREYHQRMQNAHALTAQAKNAGQQSHPRAAELAVQASKFAQATHSPTMAKSFGFRMHEPEPIEDEPIIKADVLGPLREFMKPHHVIVSSDTGEEFTLRGELQKAGVPECFLDSDGARSTTLPYDAAVDLYRHLAKGEA